VGRSLAVGLESVVSGVDRVVERVLASGTALDRSAIHRAARQLARDEAPLLPDAPSRALDALIGFGPLEPLLADPSVSDVLVNAPDDVWIERNGRLEQTDVVFSSGEAVVAAVERALLPLGLRLDRASPAVDARLPDGSRLHAVIPPAAVDGPVVAIRRFVTSVLTLDDLCSAGSIDEAGASVLAALVRDRVSLLVSGATGSGKTTLLNVLSGEIPNDERVVTVEEAAELRLGGHVVRLEARAPIVRQALRMRPDRIVVGEVRGPEALDLIQAMATGHAGSMGTVHASGPDEALWRVETLAAMAGPVPHDALRAMLRGAIGAIVHVERRSGRRAVASVAVLDGDLREVWSW
jgi:pilus assembly protein CpaF